MTFTQTVDIPLDRWLKIKVPQEIPTGPTIIAFIPTPYLLDTHAAIWLLIATAISEEISLITADTNIPQYDVSVIW